MNAPTGEIVAATLSSAMAAAFGEIEGATKSSPGQVGQQKYKYADLTSVIEAIKPALIKHGLFFTQHPKPSQGGVSIETVLHHEGGDHYSLGELFVPANKNDAQAYGSALTYARRYALVTAFGVPVEDDDGNAASASSGRDNTGDRQASPPGASADRQVRAKGEGPTKSKLDAAEKEIVAEINSCADEGMLIAYLETPDYKAAKALLEEFRPSALYGPAPENCPEYEPIKPMVARLIREFREEAAAPNILAAG